MTKERAEKLIRQAELTTSWQAVRVMFYDLIDELTDPDEPKHGADNNRAPTVNGYRVGVWYPWTGGRGECPVPGGTVGSVRFRKGNESGGELSTWVWRHFEWPSDIEAFKINPSQPDPSVFDTVEEPDRKAKLSNEHTEPAEQLDPYAPDPYAEYRPWMREGWPWKRGTGFSPWKEEFSFAPKLWGKPLGTVWDVLPKGVKAVFVQDEKVVRHRFGSTLWYDTQPPLRTVLSDGTHIRPSWSRS